MAVPQYRDEVLITLTSRDPPSSFSFPDRRLFLTKEKPVMDIGRTSKRNSSFEAAKNNAWFDSPVMSRDHANFKLDFDKQKVYIKDVGSLHGTFKNKQRLSRDISSPLASGDIIQFGISIDRGSERYPPCTMEARIRFGSINPEDRPKVFRVPDDSDVEDSGSDDDHSIRNSTEILRNANVQPAGFSSSSPRRPTIDLTGNDQYPVSNVRGDDDYTTTALPPVSPDERRPQDVTYVDLSSPSPQDTADYNGFSPVSTGPCWGLAQDIEEAEEMEEIEEESDINLTDSTDMDTESSFGGESASHHSSPASVASDTPDDFGNQDALDVEEDEFEEHDEFENGQYASVAFGEETEQNNYDISGSFAPPEMVDHIADDIDPGMAQRIHEMETNMTEASTAGSIRQDITDQSTHILPIASYMLDTQLPPIEQPKITLPPWAQSNHVSPLRLPSISEAMPPYPPSQGPDSKTVAEVMGAKTGKYEYFAARAENKTHALPSGIAPSDNAVSIVFAKSPEGEVLAADNTPQDSNKDLVAPETSPSDVSEVTQPNTSAPKRLVPSEWTASGEQFLNTPFTDSQALDNTDPPVLDETSAYQFELSKKTAAECHQFDEAPADSQGEPAKRTHMEISDILEASTETNNEAATDTNDATPSRLPKRKASDMCELTPEEESEEKRKEEASRVIMERKNGARKAQDAFRRSLARKKQQACHASTVDVAVPVVSGTSSQPPSKRLRRVAEVLSYAALGGVAVMSALIATAPTL